MSEHTGSQASLDTRTIMFRRGLVRSTDIQCATGHNKSTVARWLDAEKLEGELIASRWWVTLASVEAFLGHGVAVQIKTTLAAEGIS